MSRREIDECFDRLRDHQDASEDWKRAMERRIDDLMRREQQEEGR